MSLPVAVFLNAVLDLAIVAALAFVMSRPFRFDRRRAVPVAAPARLHGQARHECAAA